MFTILTISSCGTDADYFEKVYDNGEYKKVISEYQQAIEKYNGDARILNFVGKSYFEFKEYREALIFFDKAIAVEPYEAVYHANKCLAYAELGDLTRAAANCDRAIQINPENVYGYINRSLVNIRMQKWDWALEDLNAASQINDVRKKERAIMHANYSTVYLNLDQKEKAMENANRAIELDQGIIWAFKNRAFLHMLSSRAEEAISDIESGFLLDANDPDLLFYKGLILIRVDQDQTVGCDYIRRAKQEFIKRAKPGLEQKLSVIEKYCS